jgi:hypothetical protein
MLNWSVVNSFVQVCVEIDVYVLCSKGCRSRCFNNIINLLLSYKKSPLYWFPTIIKYNQWSWLVFFEVHLLWFPLNYSSLPLLIFCQVSLLKFGQNLPFDDGFLPEFELTVLKSEWPPMYLGWTPSTGHFCSAVSSRRAGENQVSMLWNILLYVTNQKARVFVLAKACHDTDSLILAARLFKIILRSLFA